MSNYDDAYVKQLEAENEKIREQNEILQASYEQLERFFILSSLTDMKGNKTYSITVKGENSRVIDEKDYNVLSRMGIDCEPHVDMRKKYEATTSKDIEELNKMIDEGLKKLGEYAASR